MLTFQRWGAHPCWSKFQVAGEHNQKDMRYENLGHLLYCLLVVAIFITLMSDIRRCWQVPDVEIDCAALTEKDIEDKLAVLALDVTISVNIVP